jgi:hypothetical protein
MSDLLDVGSHLHNIYLMVLSFTSHKWLKDFHEPLAVRGSLFHNITPVRRAFSTPHQCHGSSVPPPFLQTFIYPNFQRILSKKLTILEISSINYQLSMNEQWKDSISMWGLRPRHPSFKYSYIPSFKEFFQRNCQ